MKKAPKFETSKNIFKKSKIKIKRKKKKTNKESGFMKKKSKNILNESTKVDRNIMLYNRSKDKRS